MGHSGTSLPCPALPLEAVLPADREAEADLSALPTRPGVFSFEDEDGGSIALAVTANLRRLVRSRLSARSDEEGASGRRIDYRAVVRRVRAVTVGSPFEADWAYLQLARQRMPETYASLLDRWRGWFIHGNPETEFPRLTKTSTPGPSGGGSADVSSYYGPFADKHAAQRCIETLHAAFELCRHHHILVQAPNASA